MAMLAHPTLPESVYKTALVKIEDIMAEVTQPLMLADFLTDSYNKGQAITAFSL